MAHRAYLTDVQQLYRLIETSTNGQASMISVDEMSVLISLHPKSGYNAHADFAVEVSACEPSSGDISEIHCPMSYPRDCPWVTFKSPIFHPNIDNSSGSVCLNLLYDWVSSFNLLDVVKALLYLIANPNFDSPIGQFGSLVNRSLLAKKTMRLLAGLPVNGKRFAPNKAWCEWAEANGCLPTDEEEGDDDDDVASGEDVCDVAAFVEGGSAEWDGGGAVFGENVLSFANIRFPVDQDIESQLSVFDERQYTNKLVEAQRIVIWPPANSPKANIPSVFYYCELVCDGFYQNELVKPSNRPFTDDIVLPMQSHLKSRQKSSLCPWYSFYRQEHSWSHSNFTSVIDLSFLFREKTVTRPRRLLLTDDFCPWSYWDGLGTFGILEGLFSEKPQRRRNSTGSTSTENDVGGYEMAFLFNTSDDENDEELTKLANGEEEKAEKDD
ncbi:unnamed protein product, partial [Mesocestoides corti]